MEGKISKASRSISTPKSIGSSRLVRQESRKSGANLTTTVPEASGNSRPSTVALSRELLERTIRSLMANADPSLILALIGVVPTPLPESESSHPFTITLSREVLERMIRLLKPDADPSLVLALIGADLAPLPTGTTDIPDPDSENASRAEEVRKVEPGEEVEQQPQAASEDGEHAREVIVHPQEREVEKADVSPTKEGGEGARTLELEQPLPIAGKVGESLVESVHVIERGDVDSAAQEPESHVATKVEESVDTTVIHIKEMEQQLPPAEKSIEEPTVQRDEFMDVVRQITMEVEPSPTAGVPEEIYFESIPMETAVTAEPTEEAEQPLLTPEEVIANLAARNSEDTEVDMEVEENRNVELNLIEMVRTSPVEGVEMTTNVPKMRNSGSN